MIKYNQIQYIKRKLFAMGTQCTHCSCIIKSNSSTISSPNLPIDLETQGRPRRRTKGNKKNGLIRSTMVVEDESEANTRDVSVKLSGRLKITVIDDGEQSTTDQKWLFVKSEKSTFACSKTNDAESSVAQSFNLASVDLTGDQEISFDSKR